MISTFWLGVGRLLGPRLHHRLYLYYLRRQKGGDPEWHNLRFLIHPMKHSIDVGAGDGVYTARLSQLCNVVHAFEPNPWRAQALAAKVRPNVIVHREAVSDNSADIAFDLSAEDRVVHSIKVHTVRLDEMILGRVGFLRINVKGHEVAVLRGARDTIRRWRPTIMVRGKMNSDAVKQFLESEGYLASGNPGGTHIIFFPSRNRRRPALKIVSNL